MSLPHKVIRDVNAIRTPKFIPILLFFTQTFRVTLAYLTLYFYEEVSTGHINIGENIKSGIISFNVIRSCTKLFIGLKKCSHTQQRFIHVKYSSNSIIKMYAFDILHNMYYIKTVT